MARPSPFNTYDKLSSEFARVARTTARVSLRVDHTKEQPTIGLGTLVAHSVSDPESGRIRQCPRLDCDRLGVAMGGARHFARAARATRRFTIRFFAEQPGSA